MESNDELYTAVIKEFYALYRPLQKRNGLRYHSHFDVYGNNFIEIWEHKGDQRTRCICKVKEEDEIECYKKAIDTLKSYGEKERSRGYEQKAG